VINNYFRISFFSLAGADWRPTEQMINSIKDKNIPTRFELSQFPSFEEYSTSWDYEIYWLKDLYKNSSES
jgi:hypothetical protein